MSKKLNDNTLKTYVLAHYRNLYEQKNDIFLPHITGKNLAQQLHYPLALLDFVPQSYWNTFFPCGNLLPLINLHQGERLLNLGSGAAFDSFALVKIHDFKLTIVNLDLILSIIMKAYQLSRNQQDRAIRENQLWVCGEGEFLPFKEQCFDWVMLNGVLNLFPHKKKLLEEIYRILKPCGSLACAEICIREALPDYFYDEPDAWAWCMSGALTEKDLINILVEAGFQMNSISVENEGDMFSRMVFSCFKG